MSGAKRKRVGSDGGEESAATSKEFKAVIPELEAFQCPICLEVPKAAVYQCSNGHSVCSECIQKLINCPNCRVRYNTGSGRVRSHFAEKMLDSVRFRCPWTERGCDQKELKRQELGEHAEQCEFNPNTFKLCRILFQDGCSYKVSSDFLRNPRVGLPANFLAHMRNRHNTGTDFCRTVISGRPTILPHRRTFIESLGGTGTGPLFPLGICNLQDTSQDSIGLYMLFCFQDITSLYRSRHNLSWLFVRLTDPPPQPTSVSVRCTLQSCSTETDGCPKVETSWSGKIMSLKEFEVDSSKPILDREELEFSIPLVYVRKQYLDEKGDVNLKLIFNVGTSNADDRNDSSSEDMGDSQRAISF